MAVFSVIRNSPFAMTMELGFGMTWMPVWFFPSGRFGEQEAKSPRTKINDMRFESLAERLGRFIVFL